MREFAKLGLTRSVGGVLALALSRELTPVVTCIILAGDAAHSHTRDFMLTTLAYICFPDLQTSVNSGQTLRDTALPQYFRQFLSTCAGLAQTPGQLRDGVTASAHLRLANRLKLGCLV